MKTIQVLIALVIATATSYGQQLLVAVENLEDQWGFSTPSGDVVIPTQYLDAHSFMNGGAALVNVSKKEGWKIIDPAGKVISIDVSKFAPKTFAGWFSKQNEFGLQMIESDRKMGYVDGSGKLIVPVEYDRLSEFKGDYAIGEIGADSYIINKKGERTKVAADVDRVAYVINGYAPFEKNKLFGYVNEKGEVVIEAKFKNVGYFEGETAWARTPENMIGFINKSGEWVIQPQYTKATEPDPIHHIARVTLNEEVKYVKPNGEYLPIIDISGGGEFSEGFAWIKVGELVGLIDHTGKIVIEPKFTKMERMQDGIVHVRMESSWGAYDNKGKEIIALEYEKINDLSEGLIAIRKNGLWGFIDRTGKVIIAPQFAGIRDFKNGYAAAKQGTTWGLIDKQGNWTIEPMYKRVKDVEIIKN